LPGTAQTNYWKPFYWQSPFFSRFFEDPDFIQKYKDTWNNNYSDIESLPAFIDQMAAKLELSQKANFRMWPMYGGSVDYDTQISLMKQWLSERIKYLNTEINNG
jgi:hypothetical protein